MKTGSAFRLIVLLSVVAVFSARAQDNPCRVMPFEVYAEGFKFPEGPSFDPEGNLYVVDYKRVGDIGVIHPDGTAEVWLDLGKSEANGMAYSPDGRLIACDDAQKRIISIDMKTKKISVVVDNYSEPSHRPNDIVLASNGDIYFTDPNREDESIGGRVLCYSQSEKKLYVMADSLPYPNGLNVSPDRSTLYVACTVGHEIIRYPLTDNGHKAGPGKVIFRMEGGAGPDGIELDEKGNLYVSHYGMARVYYITTEGRLISCATGFGTDVTNVQIRGEWVYITEAQKGQVLRIKRSEFEKE